MATRYTLNADGSIVADPAGRFVDFADIEREHQVLTAELVRKHEAVAAELTAAQRAAAAAEARVGTLEQGIRQAQADLAHVHATDMDKTKAELGQEIDRLKNRVSTL